MKTSVPNAHSDDYGCFSYDLRNETVPFYQEYDRFDAINPYVGILADPLCRSLDIDTSSMVSQGDRLIIIISLFSMLV